MIKHALVEASDWTPLMLVMLVNNYERKGEIPQSRSQIYSDYFDHLVRAEAIAGLSPGGVKYALERVTRRTFLANNGERGYAATEIMQHLADMRDELKDKFGIDLSSERLLEVIVSAGILVDAARYLRFFHDSFESYIAARYLDDCFKRRAYEEVRSMLEPMRGNIALSEVWMFVKDMAAQSGEREVARLKELMEKKPRTRPGHRRSRGVTLGVSLPSTGESAIPVPLTDIHE